MNGTLIEMGYKQYRTINKCHTKRKKDMYVLFSFFWRLLRCLTGRLATRLHNPVVHDMIRDSGINFVEFIRKFVGTRYRRGDPAVISCMELR